MSREWSSSIVTISDREGLFAPAFCALIVRSVSVVAVKGAALNDCACLSMRCVSCEVIGSVTCIQNSFDLKVRSIYFLKEKLSFFV